MNKPNMGSKGNPPPGHNALLLHDKLQGLFYMTSCRDMAGHTKAALIIHRGGSQSGQFLEQGGFMPTTGSEPESFKINNKMQHLFKQV